MIKPNAVPRVVEESPAMQRLMNDLRRVAPMDTTVLLIGETGTGKEVIAGTIHAASKRATGPFVPVNCGALPEGLVESELFGHVRGAFSSAVADRRGLFEEASGGTLFLDEVGELQPPVQVRLLRALQERRIRPVGESRERAVDVRVVAATHRDLGELVKAGKFREDLLYRLQVIKLELPALRDRGPDLPALSRALLADIAAFHGRSVALSDGAIALLGAQPWPGNVRELRSFLEQLVVFTNTGTIEEADVRQRLAQPRVSRAEAASSETLPAATSINTASLRARPLLGWWRFFPNKIDDTTYYTRPAAELGAFDETCGLSRTMRVGRDPMRADFILQTNEVSRQHATFASVDGGVTVEDADSRNGTFLDAERLPGKVATPVKTGAVLRLGKEWVGMLADAGESGALHAQARRLASEAAAAHGAERIEVKAFERILVDGRADRASFVSRAGCLCLEVSGAANEASAPRVAPVIPLPARRPSELTAAEIRGALAAAGGNKREAARSLGISPTTFYNKMREFGIDDAG